MWNNVKRLFLLCFTLVTLSGCLADFLTPRYAVSVRSFSAFNMGEHIHPGKTFAISSLKPGLVGSLEFRSYADTLSALLMGQGYIPQTDLNATPDLMFFLDYEALAPIIRQDALSEPATMVSTPSGHPVWVSQTNLVNMHPHQVSLHIRSGHHDQNASDLYEGTAKLELRRVNMSQAVPLLLNALLQQGLFSTNGQWSEVIVTGPPAR